MYLYWESKSSMISITFIFQKILYFKNRLSIAVRLVCGKLGPFCLLPTHCSLSGPTHLSEDIAGQCLIQVGTSIYKLKQIHATAMFLHYHLVEILSFIEIHQLKQTETYKQLKQNPITHVQEIRQQLKKPEEVVHSAYQRILMAPMGYSSLSGVLANGNHWSSLCACRENRKIEGLSSKTKKVCVWLFFSSKKSLVTLTMFGWLRLERRETSDGIIPSSLSSTQPSTNTLAFFINFTTTYNETRGTDQKTIQLNGKKSVKYSNS